MARYILDTCVWNFLSAPERSRLLSSPLWPSVWLTPVNLWESIHTAFNSTGGSIPRALGQLRKAFSFYVPLQQRILSTPEESLRESICLHLRRHLPPKVRPALIQRAVREISVKPSKVLAPIFKQKIVDSMEAARDDFAAMVTANVPRLKLMPRSCVEMSLCAQAIMKAQCGLTWTVAQQASLVKSWRGVPGLSEVVARTVEIQYSAAQGRSRKNLASDFFDVEFLHYVPGAILVTKNVKDFSVNGKPFSGVMAWTNFFTML